MGILGYIYIPWLRNTTRYHAKKIDSWHVVPTQSMVLTPCAPLFSQLTREKMFLIMLLEIALIIDHHMKRRSIRLLSGYGLVLSDYLSPQLILHHSHFMRGNPIIMDMESCQNYQQAKWFYILRLRLQFRVIRC